MPYPNVSPWGRAKIPNPNVDPRGEKWRREYSERLREWIEGPEVSNNEDAEEKKRRKKKANRKRKRLDRDTVSGGSSSIEAPNGDVLASQILSRLPVKSLMRFKCVCEGWKSIFEHDSNFINLHHARSEARPGLFIAAPCIVRRKRFNINHQKRKQWSCYGFELRLLSVDLQHCDDDDVHVDDDVDVDVDVDGGVVSSSIRNVRRIQLPSAAVTDPKILGPVEGMICLVYGFSVQICNVSTGEVTPWIESTSFSKDKSTGYVMDNLECCFGFDPSTRKHKVIFLWRNLDGAPSVVCEVLTVGDSRWRIIDDVPPCYPKVGISTYANGSIYWFTRKVSRVNYLRIVGYVDDDVDGDVAVKYSESLMAFDLGSEKFRMIRIPKFTRLKRTSISSIPRTYPKRLIEMDGCVTLIRRTCKYVKMWKFHDDCSSSKDENERDCWSEVGITLPSDIDGAIDVDFHPISGKNQLILEAQVIALNGNGSHYVPSKKWNVKFARFYTYDLTKKTFSRFKIKGIFSSVPDECITKCAAFAENLLPVAKKLQL